MIYDLFTEEENQWRTDCENAIKILEKNFDNKIESAAIRKVLEAWKIEREIQENFAFDGDTSESDDIEDELYEDQERGERYY